MKKAKLLLLVLLISCQQKEELLLHVPAPNWEDQVVYFLMIDRFEDGNPDNNDLGANEYDPTEFDTPIYVEHDFYHFFMHRGMEDMKGIEGLWEDDLPIEELIKLLKPMRKKTDIEQLKKEQNFKPIDKNDFFKAETSYNEALKIFRRLAKETPQIYNPFYFKLSYSCPQTFITISFFFFFKKVIFP